MQAAAVERYNNLDESEKIQPKVQSQQLGKKLGGQEENKQMSFKQSI